jgi:hypothetical protein
VLNPVDSAVLTHRTYAKRPLFQWILVPSLSQVPWARFVVGLSGLAGGSRSPKHSIVSRTTEGLATDAIYVRQSKGLLRRIWVVRLA